MYIRLLMILMLCGFSTANVFADVETPAIAGGVTDAACTSDVLGHRTGTVYLKALWIPNKHTVSYNCGNKTGVSGTIESENNVAYESSYTLKDGSGCSWFSHVFKGWDCKFGSTPLTITNNQITMPDADVVCDAIWEFECKSDRWLHIGDEKVCLYNSEEKIKPALAIQINENETMYILLSESDRTINKDTTKKLRVQKGDKIYSAYDGSSYDKD